MQFVDRIQMIYSNQQLPIHGGSSKHKLEINLDADEYIKSVTCEYCKFGTSRFMICTLLFKTNKKETGFRSFYQPTDKVKTEYTFPKGFALACIAGKTGHYNSKLSPCIAGLKLYFTPIKDDIQAFGILNPDFSYLKIKKPDALPENLDYCIGFPTTRKTQVTCAYVKVIEGLVTFTVNGKKHLDISSARQKVRPKEFPPTYSV